jgi:hypothetical protein
LKAKKRARQRPFCCVLDGFSFCVAHRESPLIGSAAAKNNPLFLCGKVLQKVDFLLFAAPLLR